MELAGGRDGLKVDVDGHGVQNDALHAAADLQQVVVVQVGQQGAVVDGEGHVERAFGVQHEDGHAEVALHV